MKYRNQFLDAVHRSNQLGLVELSKVLPLTQKPLKQKKLMSYLEGCLICLCDLGVSSSDQLVENCALIHGKLSEFLNSNNHPCAVTIGEFYWNTRQFSKYYTLEELIDEVESPSEGELLKAHCWLTLPDGSVLDLTINADLAKVNENPYLPLEQSAIHIAPREHDPDHYYVPYLVGDEALKALKAI